jgi:hypothetical protein
MGRDGVKPTLARISPNKLMTESEFRNGLVEILTEFVTETAKAAAGEAAKEALADGAFTCFQNLAEETAKAFAGPLAGVLLKLLLDVSDKNSAKLDKLIRAPFETGVRMALDAVSLPNGNVQQSQFRDRILHDSIFELERAWTLAEGTRTQKEDRFWIRLIEGLAAREVSGGTDYARARLEECAMAVEEEMRVAEKKVRDLEATIPQLQRDAKAEHDQAKTCIYGPFMGGHASQIHQARAERYLAKISVSSIQIRELGAEHDYLSCFCRILRAMY